MGATDPARDECESQQMWWVCRRQATPPPFVTLGVNAFFVACGVKLAKVCTVLVNLPVTRPHPSTPHGWGRDRSNGAATGSGTGFQASACSRA